MMIDVIASCVFYVFVGNFIVDMFAKCGKIGYAHKIFDEILEKNVVS
jgi:pentatricopeptide repeat protein